MNLVTAVSCALSPAVTESLHAMLVKICTSRGDPLFHSFCNNVTAREMLLLQSIFHWLEQMKVRRCQITTTWCMWYDSPAKIGSVFQGLQIGMMLSACVAIEWLSSLAWLCKFKPSSLISIMIPESDLIVYPGSRKSRKITPSLSQKAMNITLSDDGYVLTFCLD